MKKLMIAMMVAGAAIAANAAKATWSSGEMYFNGDGSKVGGPAGTLVADDAATGWLFVLGKNADGLALYNSLNAYCATEDAAKLYGAFSNGDSGAKLAWGDNSVNVFKADKTSEDGAISFGSSANVYSTGDKVYSAIIIELDTNGDGIADYYTASTQWGSVTTSGLSFGTAALNWGEKGAEGTATTWNAVPEPTSGLLLLLGGAGLALRRRRA